MNFLCEYCGMLMIMAALLVLCFMFKALYLYAKLHGYYRFLVQAGRKLSKIKGLQGLIGAY